jgi:hypothetical protein
VAEPGNGMAVAGLVLGNISMVLLWVPLLNWVLSLLGIIFGAVGLNKAKRIGGKGKGMAMSGLILGILGALAGTMFVVWVWQQAKHGHMHRF